MNIANINTSNASLFAIFKNYLRDLWVWHPLAMFEWETKSRLH